MKLCILGNVNCIHVQRYVRYLLEQGLYEINLVSLSEPKDIDPDLLKKVHFISLRGRSILWKLYSRIPIGSKYLIDCEIYAHKFKSLLKKIKPDIIHAFFLTHCGYVAARAGARPLIASALGSDVLYHPERAFLYKMFLQYVLGKADVITSDAETCSKAMMKYGANGKRIVTVPFGIDLGKYTIPEDGAKETAMILSSRNLEPLYNIDLILDAMAVVVAEIPEAKIYIAGKGSQRAGLEKKTEELGIQGSVIFLDYLDDRKMAGYYKRASVFVSVPSSDATAQSLLEAMASGCFPVVSDLPANREWVKNGGNGFVIPVLDPTVLGNSILIALKNPELGKKARAMNIELMRAKADMNKNMGIFAGEYRRLLRKVQA